MVGIVTIAAALRVGVDGGALAAEIVALMDGLQAQWLLDPDGVDMAAVFAGYIRGVCRAISAHPLGG